MAPPTKFALSRLANLAKGVKRVIEHLSPRKKSKKPRIDREDDDEPIITAGSSEVTEQLSPPTNVPTYVTSVFYVGSSAVSAATPAPGGSTLTFTLHRSPSPVVTVEECEDEDSILEAYRCRQGGEILLGDIPTASSDKRSIISIDSDSSGESVDSSNEFPVPRAPPPSPNGPDPVPLRDGHARQAPSIELANKALADLKNLRKGVKVGKGPNYRRPTLSHYVEERVTGMIALLSIYTNPLHKETYGHWAASSLRAATAIGRPSTWCARVLRRLVRAYVFDRELLPINPYVRWDSNMLLDEDLKSDVILFLQGLGKDITAAKLRNYLNQPDVQEEHGISKKIKLSTATRYLHALEYRFSHPPKGQFVDGHERADVVDKRQNKFLPEMAKVLPRMRVYDSKGVLTSTPNGRPIVVWFHDESIFYAHDRRRKRWIHKDEPARPYAKGEGLSYMVADYVSADYGWLVAPDGRSARVYLKPGKNRDGYMTNEDILTQARTAMALVKEIYPNEDHMFVYDNATTHLKRPEDALSARKMPKFHKEWLIEVPRRDEHGVTIPGEKERVQMRPTVFQDKPQTLYFPPEHENAGDFKGMAQILVERGITDAFTIRAECKGFKCESTDSTAKCCCRRILFNQPDFVDAESNLELIGKEEGVPVVFLPKYHCELNFIEQCWGYAKRVYRLNPESSREDVLEANTVSALEAVPLACMRRFANRSLRFMDSYRKGLDGKEAGWAAKKYKGHRQLPPTWKADLLAAHL